MVKEVLMYDDVVHQIKKVFMVFDSNAEIGSARYYWQQNIEDKFKAKYKGNAEKIVIPEDRKLRVHPYGATKFDPAAFNNVCISNVDDKVDVVVIDPKNFQKRTMTNGYAICYPVKFFKQIKSIAADLMLLRDRYFRYNIENLFIPPYAKDDDMVYMDPSRTIQYDMKLSSSYSSDFKSILSSAIEAKLKFDAKFFSQYGYDCGVELNYTSPDVSSLSRAMFYNCNVDINNHLVVLVDEFIQKIGANPVMTFDDMKQIIETFQGLSSRSDEAEMYTKLLCNYDWTNSFAYCYFVFALCHNNISESLFKTDKQARMIFDTFIKSWYNTGITGYCSRMGNSGYKIPSDLFEEYIYPYAKKQIEDSYRRLAFNDDKEYMQIVKDRLLKF